MVSAEMTILGLTITLLLGCIMFDSNEFASKYSGNSSKMYSRIILALRLYEDLPSCIKFLTLFINSLTDNSFITLPTAGLPLYKVEREVNTTSSPLLKSSISPMISLLSNL